MLFGLIWLHSLTLQREAVAATADASLTILSLTWDSDLKTEKRYPSSDQILDGAGDVIGHVTIVRDFSAKAATFSFRSSKTNQEKTISAFRVDDPIGLVRVGTVDGVSVSGRLVELKKDANGVNIDSITIEVSSPDEPLAAQARASRMRLVALMNNHGQIKTRGFQLRTLSWLLDPKAEKRHPSSDQVLAGVANVIGDVGLDRDFSCKAANLYFVTPTSGGGKFICQFRVDDPIGQVRVGKACGVSFCGRLISLEKADNNVNIGAITVEVAAKPEAGSAP
jgi:hypothetical protein